MITTYNPHSLRHRRLGLALTVLALGGTLAFAQTNVVIEQVEVGASQIRVRVQHSFAGSANFALQGTTNLAHWSAIPGVTVAAVDSGHVELSFPKPSNAREFFRVLATVSGSTNDVDADGLPAEIEAALGTLPNQADTDNDGFNDGVEVLAGTDPLNRNSFPTQSGLPLAAFTNTVSLATEGAGSHWVTVTFDRPFAGNLHYTINPRSTAVAGTDYQLLSGVVAVAGTVAHIVVTPINDLVVQPERLLLLDLTEVAGYRMGIRSSHVVRMADDDAFWNGTFKDKYAERNFRLKLCRSNSITLACFVAGEGFDGLPILDASAPGSSISEGIIPAGCTDAIVQADSPTLFSISSPPLAAGNAGIFAGNAALARTFELRAETVNTNHLIDVEVYIGDYTERIGITNTTSSYLARTNAGAFVLMRDRPARPTIPNP